MVEQLALLFVKDASHSKHSLRPVTFTDFVDVFSPSPQTNAGIVATLKQESTDFLRIRSNSTLHHICLDRGCTGGTVRCAFVVCAIAALVAAFCSPSGTAVEYTLYITQSIDTASLSKSTINQLIEIGLSNADQCYTISYTKVNG